MKTISNAMIEKLNRLENFTLRSQGGILWDVNAPGLHILLGSYMYIKFTGERGKAALVHHSASGDFFNKTYDILTKAGLTRDVAPEVWGYIRELNKYASTNKDPETKASANLQLFRFLQELLENILSQEFMARTGRELLEPQEIFRKLVVAADSFVVHNPDGSIQLFGGYPWFDHSWGRDTFISLNGLLLITERFEYAKSVFNFYARMQDKEGLLPNRVLPNGKREYNSADASLWFVEALKKYHLAAKSKEGDTFVKKMIPTVNKIIDCYTKPSGEIYLDADKLVAVPAQWTWMDAAPGGRPVTPRNGKPVEIQALFYNALAVASEFNYLLGNRRLAARYDELGKSVAEAVNKRFFKGGRPYPWDVLDGDPHGGAVRPNAVFLLSLSKGENLLPQDKKEAVLQVIESELLTPYGLRTLSPNDAAYAGRYETFAPMEVKDRYYHQGTVWPFLMSHYVTAKARVWKDKNADELKNCIREKISSLIYTVKDKDTVPELFGGSEPYAPGGAVSQAWSVAAMIEIIDFLNRKQGAVRREAK
ncbi:MAG: amylo-alpha-1,6-glucosidase [Endomicrobiales bacterium]